MSNETANWGGYNFSVHSPGIAWNDVPGVYIFASRNAGGGWKAWYIGETDSFARRIPNHERWAEARRRGATHVHAMVEYSASTRSNLEQSLIRRYNPPLNVQHRV